MAPWEKVWSFIPLDLGFVWSLKISIVDGMAEALKKGNEVRARKRRQMKPKKREITGRKQGYGRKE